MKYMKPVTRSESSKIPNLGFVLIGQAPQEPTTFSQAWDHPSSFERREWRNAIRSELDGMKSKKVWEVMTLEGRPTGKKILRMKWVFNPFYPARPHMWLLRY